MKADITLTEALAARGYTHEPSGTPGRRKIIRVRDGRTMAVLTARQAWEWLRNLKSDIDKYCV